MTVYYVAGCGCCACSGSVEVVAYYVEGATWDSPWELTDVTLRWYDDTGTLRGSTTIAASAIPNLPTQYPYNQIPSTGDTLSLVLNEAQSFALPCGTVTLPANTQLQFTFTRGWVGGNGWYMTAPIIVQ